MKTYEIDVKHIQEVVSSFYVVADSEDDAVTKLKEAFQKAPKNIFADDTTDILQVREDSQMSFMFEQSPSEKVH